MSSPRRSARSAGWPAALWWVACRAARPTPRCASSRSSPSAVEQLLAHRLTEMRLWCVVNTMADFLDEKKREIEARLKELRPLVDEFHRLEAAAAALDGVGSEPGAGAPSRRGPRRAAAPAASSSGQR